MIGNETDFKEIWCILSLYWNYLNYSLLEKFVEEFGDQGLKSEFNDFTVRVKKFKSNTRIGDKEFIFHLEKTNENLSMEYFKEITMNLEKSWQFFTLDELELIRERIAEFFCFPSFFLNVLSASQGSISITWITPAEIIVVLKAKMYEADVMEFCRAQAITSIYVDTHEYKYSFEELSDDVDIRILPRRMNSLITGN